MNNFQQCFSIFIAGLSISTKLCKFVSTIQIIKMIRFANAKINLGLNILRKRSDGYHDIETVFYPVPLNDIIEVVPSKSKETTLSVSGRKIDCPPEKNLIMKAYAALHARYDFPPVDIYLHKIIPDGAGLGGGSSDASNILIALKDLFNINISRDELASIASGIGADCPFFIYNTPLLAKGKGDVFEDTDVSLKGKSMLLIKPDISVPTALAYSKVIPDDNNPDLKEIIKCPLTEWKDTVKNDFEKSVFETYTVLKEIKNSLYESGAVYSSMSGSGSSMFGIYDNVIMAESTKKRYPQYESFILNL